MKIDINICVSLLKTTLKDNGIVCSLRLFWLRGCLKFNSKIAFFSLYVIAQVLTRCLPFSWEPFTHAPVGEEALGQNMRNLLTQGHPSHQIFYSSLPPVFSAPLRNPNQGDWILKGGVDFSAYALLLYPYFGYPLSSHWTMVLLFKIEIIKIFAGAFLNFLRSSKLDRTFSLERLTSYPLQVLVRFIETLI